MSKVTVYTATGSKSESTLALDKAVFGIEPNHDLLGLAYRAYLANSRTANALTLTRGDVRGGGRKPHKQKGTGRSRAGSIRIPHWRGGGTVFGSTGLENYTVNMPLKMKRSAIRQALSAQLTDGKLLILKDFKATEGKVKPTVELFSKMQLSGNILLVVDAKDSMTDRATRNVSGLKTTAAKYLNVFDILNADHIVLEEKALATISSWLGGETVKTKETAKVAGEK